MPNTLRFKATAIFQKLRGWGWLCWVLEVHDVRFCAQQLRLVSGKHVHRAEGMILFEEQPK